MKKTSLLLSSLAFIIGGTAVASAAPLRDVPTGHWAASAVRSVVDKKIMSAGPGGGFQGGKVVTRYELAVALDRFIHYIEAGRKSLHDSKPQTSAVTSPGASPAVKVAIADLSRNGFLPDASPILHGRGTEPVTAQQLSDALAQVTIRLSDRSMPPAKD